MSGCQGCCFWKSQPLFFPPSLLTITTSSAHHTELSVVPCQGLGNEYVRSSLISLRLHCLYWELEVPGDSDTVCHLYRLSQRGGQEHHHLHTVELSKKLRPHYNYICVFLKICLSSSLFDFSVASYHSHARNQASQQNILALLPRQIGFWFTSDVSIFTSFTLGTVKCDLPELSLYYHCSTNSIYILLCKICC